MRYTENKMKEQLLNEISMNTSRSSGPGGQHVNKTESKVELQWEPAASEALNESQKKLLLEKLGHKLTPAGILIITCQESRSQFRNRALVQKKFLELVEWALRRPRRRIPTRPGRKAKEKRLQQKKLHSEKKQRRKNDF